MTFADQFLSMSWHLPTENVFGLGENEQRTLKHDFSQKLKYTLYASDLAPWVRRYSSWQFWRLCYVLCIYSGLQACTGHIPNTWLLRMTLAPMLGQWLTAMLKVKSCRFISYLPFMKHSLLEFQLQPGPSMKYITIGGIFDMYFFLGPTPEEVLEQYTEAVGRSQMPPYWGLGFQLCRWGYDTIENMTAAVSRTEQYGIPHVSWKTQSLPWV